MNILFELETFVNDLNYKNNNIRIGNAPVLEENTHFAIEWDIPKFMNPINIYAQLNSMFSVDKYPGLCIQGVETNYFFKMTILLSLENMNRDNCLEFMNELYTFLKQYQAQFEIISLFFKKTKK